jgi:RHS repeat-associated protein
VNLANNNAAAVWDTAGHKQYELTNHLGNVLATVSDLRIPHSTDGLTTDYYLPDITTAQDYYAFGGLMPGRTYTENSVYRYGFNSKENDNEVKGIGNQQDYGMRIYDPRVGRFLSVDPIAAKYPELTPYQFASNDPISNIDIDGLEGQNSNHGNFSALVGAQTVKTVTQQVVKQRIKQQLSKSVITEAGELILENTGRGLIFTAGIPAMVVVLVLIPQSMGHDDARPAIIIKTDVNEYTLEECRQIIERVENGKGSSVDHFQYRSVLARLKYEKLLPDNFKKNEEILKYLPTLKHIIGWKNATKMDLNDETASIILNQSYLVGKQRYAYYNEKLYEFQYDNAGGWHGYPIPGTQAPSAVLKYLRDNGAISNSVYKKLVKQSKLDE